MVGHGFRFGDGYGGYGGYGGERGYVDGGDEFGCADGGGRGLADGYACAAREFTDGRRLGGHGGYGRPVCGRRFGSDGGYGRPRAAGERGRCGCPGGHGTSGTHGGSGGLLGRHPADGFCGTVVARGGRLG